MTPRSIVVYAPSWIGDSVMSLGAVRALRQNFPDARLSILTRPWAQDLYSGCDVVDDTILYDPRGADRGIEGFWRAARRIRQEGFDVGVVFPNAFRAAALVRVAGVRERWGYATESRGFLLTKRVPQPPRPFGRHQSHFYLDLLSGLGLDVSGPDTSLAVTPSMRAAARTLLERQGWKGGALVGVHPGATNSRAKVWKASRFAEVAAKLAEAHDAQVVVLGGVTEGELAEEVQRGLAADVVLTLQGRTSLADLMGVLAELSVFLTNDSGPMHLAAALGVRTLAVFGPTDARETGPVGARARIVREPVECSPCLYRICPIDHRCMERVSAQRVFDEASALVVS
jgi:heptosyltransferase-2